MTALKQLDPEIASGFITQSIHSYPVDVPKFAVYYGVYIHPDIMYTALGDTSFTRLANSDLTSVNFDRHTPINSIRYLCAVAFGHAIHDYEWNVRPMRHSMHRTVTLTPVVSNEEKYEVLGLMTGQEYYDSVWDRSFARSLLMPADAFRESWLESQYPDIDKTASMFNVSKTLVRKRAIDLKLDVTNRPVMPRYTRHRDSGVIEASLSNIPSLKLSVPDLKL